MDTFGKIAVHTGGLISTAFKISEELRLTRDTNIYPNDISGDSNMYVTKITSKGDMQITPLPHSDHGNHRNIPFLHKIDIEMLEAMQRVIKENTK